ncbi:MAG: gluconate 2-dehydrogenase subunit 3 family protein [Candidatus Binatia bacterium]
MKLEADVLKGLMLSRRQLLRYAVVGATVIAVRPALRSQAAGAVAAPMASPGGFLTSRELAILDAATAAIIPTDSNPGARECGVVNYIQSLLSFMPGSDANCDWQVTAADIVATIGRLDGHQDACRNAGDVDGNGTVDQLDVTAAEAAVFEARPVFAGGPFSGRQPQPHFDTGSSSCGTCHGIPSGSAQPAAFGVAVSAATVNNYPPDFFTQLLPLSRLQALSWKVRILGASAVPEVAANPLATSSIEVDFRNKYRNGLAALDQMSESSYGASFTQITPAQQSSLLNKSPDQNFVTLLTYHTLEGVLSVPEYGGNRNRLGWQLVGFDGDSQPLGYTIYDESIGGYRERQDKPNSAPNPGETCAGFSQPVSKFLNLIRLGTSVQPARHFTAPYCFGVQT